MIRTALYPIVAIAALILGFLVASWTDQHHTGKLSISLPHQIVVGYRDVGSVSGHGPAVISRNGSLPDNIDVVARGSHLSVTGDYAGPASFRITRSGDTAVWHGYVSKPLG